MCSVQTQFCMRKRTVWCYLKLPSLADRFACLITRTSNVIWDPPNDNLWWLVLPSLFVFWHFQPSPRRFLGCPCWCSEPHTCISLCGSSQVATRLTKQKLPISESQKPWWGFCLFFWESHCHTSSPSRYSEIRCSFVLFSVVLEKHRSEKEQIGQHWSYPLTLPFRIFPEAIIKLY